LFAGRPISMDMRRWIEPAYKYLTSIIEGARVETEVTVVGNGYAGRIDLKIKRGNCVVIVDFKTCKAIPKEPYTEHSLQLAAYARAVWRDSGIDDVSIKTMNLYISTLKEGEFVAYQNPPWAETYLRGFRPLVQFWQWQNSYVPNQPVCSECAVPISPLDGGMCPACKANTSAECAA
jgi:RecB family exonuclease